MAEKIKIKLLGVRGSLPVGGAAFEKYGGATSCVSASINDELLFLDAGTGILAYPDFSAHKKINILLSHAHIDHLLGLPMSPFLYDRSWDVNVYLATRGEGDAKAQIRALMSPPLWPASIDAVDANVVFHDVSGCFHIGSIKIESMDSHHPGGSTVFKLSAGEKSLVYATDFEHEKGYSDKLAAFARDCGVLIYDSQFLNSEYPDKRGWGHSTIEEGLRMAERCNAALTVLFHHDPLRTDDQLDEIGKLVEGAKTTCVIGRCGEEFTV